jgi:hypothetical protein
MPDNTHSYADGVLPKSFIHHSDFIISPHWLCWTVVGVSTAGGVSVSVAP